MADTATIGTVLIPAMKRAGYSAHFAAALTAVASTIGGIIPPSIAMIILASMANLSVGALFAGGIVPGLLIGLLMMAVTWVIARRRNYERADDGFSSRAFGRALSRAAAALMIPVVLLAGLLGGYFSSVEAGAITTVVALLVGGLVYRSLSLREIAGALQRTVRLSASVFIVVAAAGPFGWLLAKVGTIQTIEVFLLSFAASPICLRARDDRLHPAGGHVPRRAGQHHRLRPDTDHDGSRCRIPAGHRRPGGRRRIPARHGDAAGRRLLVPGEPDRRRDRSRQTPSR